MKTLKQLTRWCGTKSPTLEWFLLWRTLYGIEVSNRIGVLRFKRNRALFIQSEQLNDGREGVGATWWLLRQVLSQSIYSVLVVTLLILLPVRVESMVSNRGWQSFVPPCDSNIFSGLVNTIAQASAAVLALFFTATSIVASTTFLNVKPSVRQMIMEDTLNRRYIRLLSHTAMTSILGIALAGYGFLPSGLFVVYLLVLSALCLLGFIPVGSRIFYLFDPAALASRPVRAFVRQMQVATCEGRLWLDPSFQVYACRIANEQISILEELMQVVARDGHPRNDAILSLGGMVADVVKAHVVMKASIPSNSRWFPLKAEFQRFNVMSSSLTSIALETGTMPTSAPVPDHQQVESRCISMLLLGLDTLVKRKALDDAATLLEACSHLVATCSRAYESISAQALCNGLRGIVVEILSQADSFSDPKKHLQLADLLGFAVVTNVLHPARDLTQNLEKLIEGGVDDLLSLDKKRIYRNHHPRQVLRILEDFYNRLRFEYEVEGHVLTQRWHVRKVVAVAYAGVIKSQIKLIPGIINEGFVDPVTNLVQLKKPLWASVIVVRGLEACEKGRTQIQNLDQAFGSLWAGDKHSHECGSGDALKLTDGMRSELIHAWAKLIPSLCSPGICGEDLPDVLGMARAHIGNELVRALDGKNEEVFAKLFAPYLLASEAIRAELLRPTDRRNQGASVAVMIDIQLDLMTISGLAIIYEDIDKSSCWASAKRVWDIVIQNSPNPIAYVQAQLECIDNPTLVPMLSISSMQRSKWGQILYNGLLRRGIDTEDVFRFNPRSSRGARSIPPLIEAMGFHLGSPYREPFEVFGSLYLAKLEMAKGLPLPQKVESFLGVLESRESE